MCRASKPCVTTTFLVGRGIVGYMLRHVTHTHALMPNRSRKTQELLEPVCPISSTEAWPCPCYARDGFRLPSEERDWGPWNHHGCPKTLNRTTVELELCTLAQVASHSAMLVQHSDARAFKNSRTVAKTKPAPPQTQISQF